MKVSLKVTETVTLEPGQVYQIDGNPKFKVFLKEEPEPEASQENAEVAATEPAKAPDPHY